MVCTASSSGYNQRPPGVVGVESRGVVMAVEGGNGEELRYQVKFASGTKKVLARFLAEEHEGDPA